VIQRLRGWRPHLPSAFEDRVIVRRIALFAIPAVALLLAFLAFTLPQPLTMVAASVRAETLDITVANPDEASFGLRRARLGQHGACKDDIVIRPAQGAKVNYTRAIGGPLVLAVKGRSSWRDRRSAHGNPAVVAEFWVDPNDRGCATAGHIRLPIAGALTVGTAGPGGALSESPMPVLAGELKIYGRAVDSILGGLVSLRWLEKLTNAEPSTLYVAETIALPAGSHLGQAFTGAPDVSPRAQWWGFTDADLTSAGQSDRGLWIEASTNASTLKLVAPAPRGAADGAVAVVDSPDVVSLTLAARLVGDPNLRWIFAIVSFIVVLVGVQAQLLSVPPPRREP
jgi:hypothetical protein